MTHSFKSTTRLIKTVELKTKDLDPQPQRRQHRDENLHRGRDFGSSRVPELVNKCWTFCPRLGNDVKGCA